MMADRTIRRTASGERLLLVVLFGAVLCESMFTGVSYAASEPSIGDIASFGGENYATFEIPIRPNGLETKYEVWLQCTSQSCASTEGHRVAEGSIEAGRLEQDVSVALTSLEWAADYALEVIASNKDGAVHSHPQTFTTGLSPTAGCPDGCGGSKPVELKAETWNLEGAEREAKEAVRIGEEEHARKKAEEERPVREAAERAAKERETREAAERSANASATHRCVVPVLKGDSLIAARKALKSAHCTLGKVSRPHGHRLGLVVNSQSVKHGERLVDGAAVAVTLAEHRK